MTSFWRHGLWPPTLGISRLLPSGLQGVLTLLVLITALALLLPAGPARALDVVGDRVTPLSLGVSQGQLLRLEQPATSVFIADKDVADIEVMSPRLVYVYAREIGQTSLYAVDDTDQVVANVVLTVQTNTAGLNPQIRRAIPDAPVSARPAGPGIELRGEVETPSEAANAQALAGRYVEDPALVLNRLQVTGSSQVNLRVRFAEVQRASVQQLGINWNAVANAGNFQLGLLTGNGVFPDIANTTALASNGYLGAFRTSDVNINVLLDALETESLVNILAEPNLTALSGETASFLAGGEFPIPVAGDNDSITVEFKEFGVSLDFTPTVLSPNRISMRVRPEVSQLSSANSIELDGVSITIPSLITRRAETTVELGSGQTFAIAGMFQSTFDRADEKIPGLGDLPVIGRLFQSVEFQRDETELVILVTPYIVQPVSDRSLTLPTDPVFGASRTAPGGPAPLDSDIPPQPLSQVDRPTSRQLAERSGFILK
ncbi:MAG: type II and III secretion system protein family protein [Pseudomonadota bacterium]